MAKYQELIYGSGVTYGEVSRVAFTAEPMSAIALSHSEVQVTWTIPSNSLTADYVGFRIVRNQDAYPETEEDGVILYEFYTRTGAVVDQSQFLDGVDTPAGVATAPLVSGRYVYYRAWILLDPAGDWVRAGDVYTLLPSNHASGTSADTAMTVADGDVLTDVNIGSQALSTTHDRLMGYIPRVFLSANTGPTDAIEPYDADNDPRGVANNSLLNQFLYGFSLTVDEMLNHAEFISPESSGKNTDPNILVLQSHQFNLPLDTAGVSRNQKRMVREAMYTYKRKGTVSGLQTAVESITGFDADIYSLGNLMLSPQDSTFFHGTGFWAAGTGCTLTANAYTFATPTLVDSPWAIDLEWTGKVVVSDPNSAITNGIASPITRGIPVTGATSYSLGFFCNYNDDPGSSVPLATLKVYWFDRVGHLISKSSGITSTDATNSWVHTTGTATSPANAAYAGIEVTFNTSGLWYVDMFHFNQNVTGGPYFSEARDVYIFLNPPKVNYILNPSFEANPLYLANHWSTNAQSAAVTNITVGGVYDGPMTARARAKKLTLMANANSTGESSLSQVMSNIPAGKFYTFSFFARSSANVPAQVTVYPQSSGTDGLLSKDIEITTTWQRFYITHYLSAEDPLGITLTVKGNWDSSVLDFDCFQYEPSYYPTDYFDGSLTLTGGAWAGEPDDSVSYMYPAQANRMLRLQNYIENYLPLNTPYSVKFYKNDGNPAPQPKGIS